MSLPLSVRSTALTFLSFAMPVSMLGVVWPDVRERFDQSLGTLGVVSLVYGIARMSTSGTGRAVTRRMGIGPSFVVGLVGLIAADLVVAAAVDWSMFLAGVAAIGVVSGLLDSVGAGVIASLGDVGSAGIVHGSYGLGATVGPLVVVMVPDWRWSIAVTAVVGGAALVSAVVARNSFPVATPTPAAASRPTGGGRPPSSPTAVSLATFFAFVAVEVTIGNWLFTYLTEARHLGETIAGLAVSGFWGGTMAGRLVLVSDRARRVAERVGLPAAATVAAGFFAATVAVPDAGSVVTATFAGLGLAPIVPTLTARTANRVGIEHAQQVSGWQLLAANAGAISIPFLTGGLIDSTSPSAVPVVAMAVFAAGIPLLVVARRLSDRSVT